MYQSENDKTIVEDDLAVILKTALGVSELSVTDIFRAIDEEEKNKITFGKYAIGLSLFIIMQFKINST